MTEIPHKERLPSQIFAEWARKWVALDGAARLLEENRKTVFHQLRADELAANPKASISAAEGNVYVNSIYIDYIKEMVETRTKANEARVAMKFAEIRAQERSSEEAAARMERRMMGNNG